MITREDLKHPVSLLRFFKDGQQWGDPYVAVMALSWESPEVVEATGFHGDVTHAMYHELARWFRDNGVKKVKAVRSIGHTMPGARDESGAFVFDVIDYCDRHRL